LLVNGGAVGVCLRECDVHQILLKTPTKLEGELALISIQIDKNNTGLIGRIRGKEVFEWKFIVLMLFGLLI
jgi:hypothetical protein